MIRQDRYQVGDKVQFILADEFGYLPSNIPHRHEIVHGKGPYTVEAVKDFGSAHRAAGHTQLVEINDEEFSGWWFQPIR